MPDSEVLERLKALEQQLKELAARPAPWVVPVIVVRAPVVVVQPGWVIPGDITWGSITWTSATYSTYSGTSSTTS